MSNLTPKRPYLLRAFYEWIVDNGMTPHIVVDARSSQVVVPRQFVKEDGSITLNISMTAVHNLMMRNDEITFDARFGGKAHSVYLPIWSVMAIYAREEPDGISFSTDEYAQVEMQNTEAKPRKPTLRAVDAAPDVVEEEVVDAVFDGSGQGDAVDGTTTEQDDTPPPPKSGNTKSRPSFLRVVK